MAVLSVIYVLLSGCAMLACGFWHLAVISIEACPHMLGSRPEDALFFMLGLGVFLASVYLLGGQPSWRLLGGHVGLSVLFLLSCSYYPHYSDDLVWRKNGELVETSFSLPFTRIYPIPKSYQVGMEMPGKEGNLQVTATFCPDQEYLLVVVPSEVRETLYKHIGSQMAVTVALGEESLTRLQESLSVLPEKLPGKISGKIQILSDTGQVISELSFSNDVSTETSSFL